MAASLLHTARNVAKKRQLSFAQSAVFIHSGHFNTLGNFSLHDHKNRSREKSFHRFITYATLFTSGICYSLYNSEDEERNILHSIKNVVFPTVAAKSATSDVSNNRDRYNFIADVVEKTAPSVVYIEIKDQKR